MALELFTGLEVNLLFDLAAIIVFATIIAFFARLLKQPLILGYIIAGIILGPEFLKIIQNQDIVLAFSEIGIAFLLFFVGLEMNLKKLKEVGFISTLGTLIQVTLTFLAGFFAASYLGFPDQIAAVIGLIIAFSSTSVVIKLLSDKEEINTLHGRISLGILLMQDIIIIFLLSSLSTIQEFSITALSSAFLKGILLITVAIIASSRIFPKLFDYAAKYQELLLLLSLTALFFFSTFASFLGFSIAVGTFIAGVALASLPYHIDIIGLVKPLKDFFVTIFFVALGMQLQISQPWAAMATTLALLTFVVVVIKPFIIMVIASCFGYERGTSFFTALSFGQVSEFSLILVTLALNQGLVTREIFSLTVLLVAITMVTTVYFVNWEKWLYMKFSRVLAIFEKLSFTRRMRYPMKPRKKDIVLFGCGRMGGIFLSAFKKLRKKVLVIDYNPAVIKDLRKENIDSLYGDLLNDEVLKVADLSKAEVVISTVKEIDDNLHLISYMKKIKSKAKVIVLAEHLHQALDLYEAGADYVIVPRIVSGEKMSTLITDVMRGRKKMERLRKEHVKHIILLEKFKYASIGKD